MIQPLLPVLYQSLDVHDRLSQVIRVFIMEFCKSYSNYSTEDSLFIVMTLNLSSPLESVILTKKKPATKKLHSDYLVVYLFFPQLHLGQW